MVQSESAKALMYWTLDASQKQANGVRDTAFELWNKIQENNEGNEKDIRNNALAAFLGFRYNKGETVNQYGSRYEFALGRLTSAGQEMDNSTKIWVFRNTLP